MKAYRSISPNRLAVAHLVRSMVGKPTTTLELVVASGLDRSTVDGYLRAFKRIGLVERLDNTRNEANCVIPTYRIKV